MQRISSLTSNKTAGVVDPTIDTSAYDAVKRVADDIPRITSVADLDTIGKLDEVILAAYSTSAVITMNTATGAEGTQAVWDYDTKTLTIPIGTTGPAGLQGATGLTGVAGLDGAVGADGAIGLSVHHATRTIGSGLAGQTDTYTIYGDLAELISMGTFQVYNGANGIGAGDMLKLVYDSTDNGIVDNAEKVNGLTVETAVPLNAIFTDTNTDTIYDDTLIQAAVTLNTAKVSNIAHPLVETAVPLGAVFTDTNTDTVYNDTAIQAEVTANTNKLVGIEAGATADQSAAEILTLLKTVDTNTSGLNADTLDGIQATSFLRSDADDFLDNATYLGSHLVGGPGTRMLGINATDVAYVGPIDAQTLPVSGVGNWNFPNQATISNNDIYHAGNTDSIKGLIVREEIPGAANLNTYKTTGLYHQDANVDAANGLNYPTPNAGQLQVIANIDETGLFIYQQYSQYNSNRVFRRSSYSTNWQAWVEVASTIDNVASATQASNAALLDNLDSTQFLRSDANDVATGSVNFSNKAQIRGYVPGQDSSGAAFQVNGFQRTGAIIIHDAGVGGTGVLTGTGLFLLNESSVLKWDSNTIYHSGNLPTTIATASNAELLDNIDSTGFARLGTVTPPDNYLYTTRTSVNDAMYVRQGSTGGIARFFQSATVGATSGTSQVDITNAGGITATGGITTKGKFNVEFNAGASPTYSSGTAEFRSTNGDPVSIGFHRSGFTACQLRHNSNGLILSGSSPTNSASFYAYGSVTAAGQLNSSIATGTAPLTVASTTKVTNLNADLIDGIDSTNIHHTGNHISKAWYIGANGATSGWHKICTIAGSSSLRYSILLTSAGVLGYGSGADITAGTATLSLTMGNGSVATDNLMGQLVHDATGTSTIVDVKVVGSGYTWSVFIHLNTYSRISALAFGDIQGLTPTSVIEAPVGGNSLSIYSSYHSGNIPILNQDTTGNAGTATALTAGAKTISGSLTLGTAAGSQGILYIYGSTAGAQSEIKTTSGNLHIDSESTHATYLNYYSGTGGVIFGNGANTISGASVSSTGVVTGTSFVGPLTGNATTATTLQTARTINGVSFNGSANITVNAVDSTARALLAGSIGQTFKASTMTANIHGTTAGNSYGYSFWGANDTYSIQMGNNQANHGTVTDYSMHHTMGTTAGRGFTFGSSRTAVAASINALTGAAKFNGSVTASSYVGDGSQLTGLSSETYVNSSLRVSTDSYSLAADYLTYKTNSAGSWTVATDGTVTYSKTDSVAVFDTPRLFLRAGEVIEWDYTSTGSSLYRYIVVNDVNGNTAIQNSGSYTVPTDCIVYLMIHNTSTTGSGTFKMNKLTVKTGRTEPRKIWSGSAGAVSTITLYEDMNKYDQLIFVSNNSTASLPDDHMTISTRSFRTRTTGVKVYRHYSSGWYGLTMKYASATTIDLTAGGYYIKAIYGVR